ncbi:MAG: protein translocase subunit SecD [Parcubacteria group bacterium]|nr:MAG: protein translocase subunit SecD [Parcubacteria group bacterium]
MNKYNQPALRGQISKNTVRATFIFIFILTFLAVLIDLPQSWGWFNKYKIHLGLDLQGGTHLVYQADVSQVPTSEQKDSVEALRNVIERRVNVYGVSEPIVQTNYSGNNARIIVELAGVKNINDAIAIIDKTPQLDFRLQSAAPVSATSTSTDEIRKKAEEVLKRVLAGEDFAKLAQQYSEDPGSKDKGGDLPWVTEGKFVPEFDQAIFKDLKPGQISKTLVESQFGYHIIKKIEEQVNEQGQIEVHAAHILFSKPNADLTDVNWIAAGLTGRHIKKASLNFDPNTQQPLVMVEFNDEGKSLFGKITTANIGKPVGIFLDNELISSPTVQEAITDGRAQISGKFTVNEAKQLVKDLNLGALPVPIQLISQQTVGATLGDIYVKKSLIAGIIGFLAAALFMLIYYRLPGFISVLALGIYTAIALAIFILIPVTMTMAGVAGFILSIGMAVDANVLIFERTKEELIEGKSLYTAVENGFHRAWSSIRDSNISSIITCIILAWFGTSIIKGFAITLGIGILISMFSAITVTRTFLRLVVSRKLESKLGWFGVNTINKVD